MAHFSEPEAVFGPLGLSEGVLADLKATIARRLTPKPVKVRADVEVKCFAYAGIEAIRRALQAGEDASTEDVKINVRLVAPPLYVMTTTSTDKTAAIEVMEKAVDIIGETIASEGGDMTVKMKVGSGVVVVQWRGMGQRGRRRVGLTRSPRSCRRRRTPSSRRSWSNSSRRTWTSRATTTRTRRSKRCACCLVSRGPRRLARTSADGRAQSVDLRR